MSALGRKQTFASQKVMSALPRKQTCAVQLGTSALGQKRTHATQQKDCYSITSSALASSDAGTVRPSILVILVLMTKSNLVDCTTGRSAGLAPLRIRPT